MIYPKPLQRGDTVALISPSSPADSQEIIDSIAALEKMGFKVEPGESLYLEYAGFMSGSGRARAIEINNYFKDSQIKAIFCIRGGYSANHVLPYLNYDLIAEHPKIFMGYSDVTALHLAFNQRSQLVTFHGPMVCSDILKNFDTFTSQSFWQILMTKHSYAFLNPEPLKVIFSGKATGTLIGGNLSLIMATLGTPFQIDLKDKILFIEDIGENVPRLDRMLFQLKLSGLLDNLTGLLVGDFNNCNNQYSEDYQVIDVIYDLFKDLNIPVMYGLQAGHCSPNLTLPLGANCQINTIDQTINFSGWDTNN